jgi:hypothetical protein
MRDRPRVEHGRCNVMMTGRCLDQVAHASGVQVDHPLSATEGLRAETDLAVGYDNA